MQILTNTGYGNQFFCANWGIEVRTPDRKKTYEILSKGQADDGEGGGFDDENRNPAEQKGRQGFIKSRPPIDAATGKSYGFFRRFDRRWKCFEKIGIFTARTGDYRTQLSVRKGACDFQLDFQKNKFNRKFKMNF